MVLDLFILFQISKVVNFIILLPNPSFLVYNEITLSIFLKFASILPFLFHLLPLFWLFILLSITFSKFSKCSNNWSSRFLICDTFNVVWIALCFSDVNFEKLSVQNIWRLCWINFKTWSKLFRRSRNLFLI